MKMPCRRCETSTLANMRAVRLHAANDLRVETVRFATRPAPDDVVVKVAYAGLCGSDIHNFKTGQWISRAPSVAGHEFSGWVESVGSAVSGFQVGDRVAVDSRYTCGACPPCLSGKGQLCQSLRFVGEAIDGGFAEYATVPARLLLKAGADAPMDILALAEPLAVALHAMKRLAPRKGDPLLIIGCGPIGALSALVAAQATGRTIVVTDRNVARAKAVCAMTGAHACAPGAPLPTMTADETPIRHVLDTTGNVQVIGDLIAGFSGATIGLVGIGSGKLTIDPVELVERELALVGCHAYEDEFPQAVDLLHARPETFRPVIGEVLDLEKANDAYGDAIAGRSTGIKTLFAIGGTR